jgi:phenylacetate-CoA ligase
MSPTSSSRNRPSSSAIYLAAWCLDLCYELLKGNRHSYCLLHFHFLQTWLVKAGEIRARRVQIQAIDRCPAYADFSSHWGTIPTTKENYVKKYSIEDRCYGGQIPLGAIVDESSGSSGLPSNWVRSRQEQADLKRSIQRAYQLTHGDRYRSEQTILLNCFALGSWATGMNVSTALADVGILKSIGCDRQKLENTLRQFGSNYRYLIFGYPPFIKSFIDLSPLDLSQYRLNLIVGGEPISEGLRSYLLTYFETVISSYGASDLEINLGRETDLTIALRRLCQTDPALSHQLFGRSIPPAIFQYNPIEHLVETSANGELIYTVTRSNGAAPKVRYNLLDRGGAMTYVELAAKLRSVGIDIDTLAPKRSHLPLLFIYGRSDLTISFYGANIYPAEIAEIIQGQEHLKHQIHSFQLSYHEDNRIDARLKITLELMPDLTLDRLSIELLRDIFWQELSERNQDFREVSKMFDRRSLEIELQAYGTGVFCDRDPRTKHAYIAGK